MRTDDAGAAGAGVPPAGETAKGQVGEVCQALIAQARQAVVLLDRDGRLLLANPAARELYGPALATDRPLDPGGAFARLASGTLLEDALERDAEARDVLLIERLADESCRRLLASAWPIRGPARTAGAVLVAEEAENLRRLRDRLCRQEQLEALGKLAAALAHEVRNPLTAMDMHIALLAEKLTAVQLPEPQRIERYLTIIRTELRRLDEMLDHFSGFTRRPELKLEPVDIRAELQELHDLLNLQAEKSGIRLRLEVDPAVGRLQADRVQLRQALLNLVLNAMQATGEGGEVVLAAARLPAPERIRLRVQDTGSGIPDADRQRIFDLFFTTKPGGIGLGLSLVHSIVTDHNGTLDVQSLEGQGSTFTIEIPVLSGRPSCREEASPGPKQS